MWYIASSTWCSTVLECTTAQICDPLFVSVEFYDFVASKDQARTVSLPPCPYVIKQVTHKY